MSMPDARLGRSRIRVPARPTAGIDISGDAPLTRLAASVARQTQQTRKVVCLRESSPWIRFETRRQRLAQARDLGGDHGPA